MVVLIVLYLGVKPLCCLRPMHDFIFIVKVTEWSSVGKIAAYLAYDMFSWYK